MGVNGLWQVVQPCARPTNLATLNRKRLAVDASIWIYQFLKAVRDKEGNALRNSHVVGFFRRICKLLWFGIKPVFVFDGGAPALKRQTIQNRKRRREGHREDAVRTAGKLLAVQMQRLAEDEVGRRRKKAERPGAASEEQEEMPDMSNVVYVDEIGMSQQERERKRKFHKKDAYHLPELDGGIANMGNPEDPRIMSIQELEEYARQFNSGQDINLYDFSKIDFEGDFFNSLPAPDRYNILNAARLRSRLRMGLSKDQLEVMFPNRMDFSRFQIERVRERNMLTQRLMRELGMVGAVNPNLEVNARIAGEKNREYVLVKNDGAEGGWALGVVNKEKDFGESHKPIDVDALDFQYQAKDDEEEEDEDEFEDVPIPGLNRLPPVPEIRATDGGVEAAEGQQFDDSLFVGGSLSEIQDDLFRELQESGVRPDEQADINKAIALSLQNQHAVGLEPSPEVEDDVPDDVTPPAPTWTQKRVEESRPITAATGNMIAHIVNNRANAAVAKQRAEEAAAATTAAANDSDSDDEVDFQQALAVSRKANATMPRPSHANVRNPFDGPLPFPKLDWKHASMAVPKAAKTTKKQAEVSIDEEEEDYDMAGGFEREAGDENAPKPLPPWLADNSTDIRESVKKQDAINQAMNEADRSLALEEEREYRRRRQDELIEIESSDDNDSDIEIIDGPPLMTPAVSTRTEILGVDDSGHGKGTPAETQIITLQSTSPSPEPDLEVIDAPGANEFASGEKPRPTVESPEPEFEDVSIPQEPVPIHATVTNAVSRAGESPELELEDVQIEAAPGMAEKEPEPQADVPGEHDDYLFGDAESVGGFSDPEEEELLAQMEQEDAEHVRFAAELNNRTEEEIRKDLDKEIKQLRAQQKKDRRDADEVSDSMVPECQALLRLFGLPYITAPMEAEAQCAELVKLGLVDGIVTDDSDIFLFGGTRVYKNIFNNNKFVECYLGQDLEREMSLAREQLVALAQLLGSDYTEGLPGVGPVTAVEILSEFPGTEGLEEFAEWWQDVQNNNRPKDADASSPFRRKFRKAQSKKLFLPPGFPSPAVADAYLHPIVDDSSEPFEWGVPDVEGLRQFLMATIGWDKERTDEVLLPVVKDMNRREVEGTQANITRFFQGGVGAGALEPFAPRVRVTGSKRMGDAVAKLRQKTGAGAGAGAGGNGGATVGEKRKRRGETAVDMDDEFIDGDGVEDDGERAEGSDDGIVARRRNRGRGKKLRN